VAKKVKAKANRKKAAKPANPTLIESALTKGELRKLNALRKSVGDELGEKTFREWLKKQRMAKTTEPEDENAALIAETLWALIEDRKLKLPRGGYIVTRGRGRVIVTQAEGT